MSTAKAYVYFENNPETEEFDEELSMLSCTGSERCLFSGDLENAGFQKEWLPEGEPIPPTGFYEVEYEWDTDDERDDCGYVAYTYAYVVGMISMKKSLKARWLWIKNMVIEPKVDFVLSIFQRRWGVDITYGGIGHGSRELWLPQAVWRRYTARWRDLPWGPDYTEIELRRY